jgi:uncharacterized protein YjdB
MRRRLSFAAVLLATACADGSLSGPRTLRDAVVAFDVQGALYVRSIAVEVSGPGIDSLLVINITVDTTGHGAGTARIPAGTARLFAARAFDAYGVNTHRGDTTVSLVEGANPTVALVLTPLIGSLPITLTFGGVGLTLTPGDTTVALGDSVQFTAGGVDSLGNAIPPGSVVWSSSDQSVVLVNTSGLARTRSAGAAFVLATYQGATVGRKVTVTP